MGHRAFSPCTHVQLIESAACGMLAKSDSGAAVSTES
jgi:hypothetical protein